MIVLDVIVYLLVKPSIKPFVEQGSEVFLYSDFTSQLFVKLCGFGLNVVVKNDYPCGAASSNILLVDATFDEVFADVDLSFPVLKILKSYPDFTCLNFHDFIVYPFPDAELISRIINLYNTHKNIQYFRRVNNDFKSYLLNLSHDVYSPAKLIKSQIEYLRIGNKNDYHETIYDATLSQLSKMISVLMFVPYSSVVSDNILIDDNNQPCNFASLIRDIVTQLGLYATNQGVDITLRIEPQAEDTCVVSNYTYLWRMVYNLVLNAIKYCLSGGFITLSLLKIDNVLRFEVKDTGIGMTASQLETVRQYFAATIVGSGEGELGFGRGMVIVKLVVNSLSAAIAVDSELGVGTVFMIDFNV